MSTEITVAVISGLVTVFASICTLVGVVIMNKKSNRDAMNALETQQKVFEAHVTEKIGVLTEEVRKYNNVKSRTSNLETEVAVQQAMVKELQHKVEVLGRA